MDESGTKLPVLWFGFCLLYWLAWEMFGEIIISYDKRTLKIRG